MNNQENSYTRKRGQTLLIVEGNHEKNELFQLIFRSFPQLSIRMDDIWIYGTNIYMLYDAIVKEYGEDWYDWDIDLPFLISSKQGGPKRYKDNFTNIFLVFDYERHDPRFSEEKISQMQTYFADAADFGKLYINYPMIESYQHLKELPDPSYSELKVPVSLRPGRRYKALVKNTFMDIAVSHSVKVHDLLSERFGIVKEEDLKYVVERILGQNNEDDFLTVTEQLLTGKVMSKDIKTAVYQIRDLVWKIGYVKNGKSYWQHMRNLFIQIIFINIDKAYRIQYGKDAYLNGTLDNREKFNALNEQIILNKQNEISRNEEDGFIWVLNTCIMLVAEYNFRLLVS